MDSEMIESRRKNNKHETKRGIEYLKEKKGGPIINLYKNLLFFTTSKLNKNKQKVNRSRCEPNRYFNKYWFSLVWNPTDGLRSN